MSQPEWGMITALVSTARASWIMGIFRASHDDRFHKTPAEDSRETGGENQCRGTVEAHMKRDRHNDNSRLKNY